MRYLAILLLLPGLVFAIANAEKTYHGTLVKVLNGATLKLDVTLWPGVTRVVGLRLRGIDTPGMRDSSPCEKELAKKATEFTRQFVSGHIVVVTNVGGRHADISKGNVSVGGKDLAEALISAGHGRAYDGGSRGSWCE